MIYRDPDIMATIRECLEEEYPHFDLYEIQTRAEQEYDLMFNNDED